MILRARRPRPVQKVPTTTLGDLPTGTIVQIKEDGVFHDFVVAQHDYIQAGVTAIERRLCLAETVAFNADVVNTYAGGTLDTFLTDTYRNRLDQKVRDALVTVNIPVAPGKGDYNLTTIARSVFVLSGTENGLSLPEMVVEGSRVDIYTDNASRIKYSDDAPTIARDHWTRSAHANNPTYAWRVSTNGTANYVNATNAYYLAPVLTLQSTTPVNPDLTIT